MEYLKLLGIVIVIAGFALKLDSILIIVAAALVTALVGGLSVVELLETLGSNFMANRSMAIFIIIMFVTGTLERNGLREAAAALIGKFKGATSGIVIGIYGVMRAVFAAFNVGFGGVAGFVRPVIMPMAEGAVTATGKKIHEDHLDELKGMAAGMENSAHRMAIWEAAPPYSVTSPAIPFANIQSYPGSAFDRTTIFPSIASPSSKSATCASATLSVT